MTHLPREETVAHWFEAHGAALLLYARQWVGAAEADDVIQRVFVRLLTAGKLPDAPNRWLYRSVRNEAITAWRANWRRGQRERTVASESQGWFRVDPDDPLRAIEAQGALQSLPTELREVVTLRLWSSLTLSEIAEVTGVAVSTVHARYTAAIESLRQTLEPPCRNSPT